MSSAEPLFGTPVSSLASRQGAASRVVTVVIGAALLALSAKVQVPFWPVPMTMQTLVVLLLGTAYGARLGVATVLLYLVEGAVGLPVFAGAGAGPGYMAGPTAGYLVGFVAAAWLAGTLAERGWDRSLVGVTAAMALGHALVFVPGIAWLATFLGTEQALAVGLLPFIGATVLKTLLGAGLMQAAWRGRAALR
jgi:biotin transport system substrate-specific component